MSGQLSFAFEHRPSLSGDDFLVSPSNRDAVSWLDAWPDWPAPLLVIYGPAGSGKSHLGQVFRARTGATAIACETLGGTGLPDLLAQTSECLIDGVEGGIDEEALLHLYNAVAQAGGHILMTAHRSPSAWGIDLADLRSRLLGAPAVAIGRPDDALIRAVLVKLFSDRQLRVDADIVEFLARRMERSLGEAQRLVDAVDRAALARRRDITLPLVREILNEPSPPEN